MAVTTLRIGAGANIWKKENFKTYKRSHLGSRITSALISEPFGARAKKGTLCPFFEMGLDTF